MGSIIKLEEVTKSYHDGASERQVLFDINLDVEEGSFNSIVGPSGCGKSTLLNIIGTLDRPDRGRVYIDGHSITELNNDRIAELRNETIGFVFQYHYLLPDFTTLENVMMPHFIRTSRMDGELRERAEDLLDMVGLSERKHSLSTRMSAGQQQRAAIARALINAPKIILADEPTGNLDSENTDKLYTLFREINSRLGTTFVIITHDLRIAEKTDRVIQIQDGRLEPKSSRIRFKRMRS